MTNDTVWRFGRREVDSAARCVRLDGLLRTIEPKPFDLLVHLVRHRSRVVTKEELTEKLWPHTTVSASALARIVMKARQAIGDDGKPALILSVPRVGYRFIAPLDHEAARTRSAASPWRSPGALPIAVLPFVNDTGDDALGWIELGVMALATNALGHHPMFAPVSLPSLLVALDGTHNAGQACLEAAVYRVTGAKAIVHSQVDRASDGYRLEFQLRGAAGEAQGRVVADQVAELGIGLAAALAERLFPDVPAAEAGKHRATDPLATESFARGMAALAQHQWAQAANLLRLAADLSPGDCEVRLELLRALSNAGGNEALRVARRLMSHAEKQGDILLASRVHQALGRMCLVNGQLIRADYWLTHSIRLAEGQETPVGLARTLMLQASVAVHRGDHHRSTEILQRMYRQCELSGDRILPIAGLNFEAIDLADRGEFEQAVERSMQAIGRARELRATSYLIDACDNAAWDLARLGRLAEAAAFGEEAVAASRASRSGRNAVESMPAVCWIYGLSRDPSAAAALVGSLAAADEMLHPEDVWRCRGLLAAGEGRHADAAGSFRAAIERYHAAQDAYHEQQTLPWLIDSLILAGQFDEAQAFLASGPRFASIKTQLGAQLLHAQALLAHARNRADEALSLLQQLVQRRPAPLWRALALLDAAWLHAEAGDPEASGRLLADLPSPLSDHPLAFATRARVLCAVGDTAAAHKAQCSCLAALGSSAPLYLVELADHYAHFAPGCAIPRTPRLPSRL